MLKSFVKWVGGKNQLLSILEIFTKEYQEDLQNGKRIYFEPFLGVGALFLHLQPSKAIINDINEELITTWKTLKTSSREVINLLEEYVQKLNEFKEKFYYQLRDEPINQKDPIYRTARFIFLNKTGFNGIYRVNSKNKFNVTFNKKTNINLNTIVNLDNLKQLIRFLNKKNIIQILQQDFVNVISQAQKGDLIFCDPPYDIETKSSFDSYNPIAFGKEGQIRLFNELKKADERGVIWILTNHSTKFINDLYKDFNIQNVPVDRFINSNGDKRKNATFETIITSYPLSSSQQKEIDLEIFSKELKTTSFFLSGYTSWKKHTEFLKENENLIEELNNLCIQIRNRILG
ncbi:DNA adenine methylase ['Camptotheca acuminata' phytoplasma]|uniref:DNA adenine methylase n=1 Tax='Camptotheca acuminata' phytoplasma TaxID=3239192 RepID=UPI00351A0117